MIESIFGSVKRERVLVFLLINELKALLEKVLSLYPQAEKDKWNRSVQKTSEKPNLYESYDMDMVD